MSNQDIYIPPQTPQFPVTKTLIGLNVAVFAAMVLSGVSFLDPQVQQLVIWGADFGPYTLNDQWWRVLSSMFVHAGIIHIGLNMWCLWNLGPMAEKIFGRASFLVLYLLTGLGSSLTSLWFHPQIVSVGASGAIFGVAGALISALKLGRLPFPAIAVRSSMRSLIAFAGYNLLFGGIVPFIDNSAHIGGLVTGLAVGALLSPTLMDDAEALGNSRRTVFTLFAVLLSVAFYFLRKKNGF